MVEPLRHRQTKGAATDMFYLTPPCHISTLPKPEKLNASICFPLCPRKRTQVGHCGMSKTCQSRHFAPQQNRPLLDHLVGAGEHGSAVQDPIGSNHFAI